MIPHYIVNPGHDLTLAECSDYTLKLMNYSKLIVTPGHDSILNYEPGSKFPVVQLSFGFGVTIQRGILTRVII